VSWFSIRRLFGGAMAIITFVFIACLVRHQEENLRQASFTSGYFLAAGILFLALYNVRKRITGIPVGSSTAWLQLHIYIGFVMIAKGGLTTGKQNSQITFSTPHYQEMHQKSFMAHGFLNFAYRYPGGC